MLGGVFAVSLGLLQIGLKLATALPGVLNGLLDAGYVRPDGIVAALHGVKLILQFRVLNPAFLNLGVFVDLIGNKRLHFQFQIANSALLALGLLGQLAILEPLQLRLKKTLFLFVRRVFLCRLGLALQAAQLPLQLVPNVRQPLQVLHGAAHTVLRVAAALFVFGDARSLFDIGPQVFRLGLNQPRNHSLLNNGITTWAQTGAQEEDRKSTRLNSSHVAISYAVFCLKKKKNTT